MDERQGRNIYSACWIAGIQFFGTQDTIPITALVLYHCKRHLIQLIGVGILKLPIPAVLSIST